jgi:hypothetical protein
MAFPTPDRSEAPITAIEFGLKKIFESDGDIDDEDDEDDDDDDESEYVINYRFMNSWLYIFLLLFT